MTDNTITASNGIDVYQNDIYRLADDYICIELGGSKDDVTDNFVSMIFYIADNMPKPSNDDIVLLDGIFDIYIRLCAKYKVSPTMEAFGFLVGIHRATFHNWSRGAFRDKLYYTKEGTRIKNINTWRINHPGADYVEIPSTTYSDAVKKWVDTCRSFVVHKLQNKSGSDANLIFVAKAAYGLVETAPVPVANEQQFIAADEALPTLEDMQSNLELCEN